MSPSEQSTQLQRDGKRKRAACSKPDKTRVNRNTPPTTDVLTTCAPRECVSGAAQAQAERNSSEREERTDRALLQIASAAHS